MRESNLKPRRTRGVLVAATSLMAIILAATFFVGGLPPVAARAVNESVVVGLSGAVSDTASGRTSEFASDAAFRGISRLVSDTVSDTRMVGEMGNGSLKTSGTHFGFVAGVVSDTRSDARPDSIGLIEVAGVARQPM